MNARIAEVPDTARRHLLALARRQLALPDLPVDDEVSAASTLTDPAARNVAFTALRRAVHGGDTDGIDTALNTLTGGSR